MFSLSPLSHPCVMKISQQDGDSCCGPRSLGGGARGGGRDFCISKYLGSGCRIFSEHVQTAMRATGNQSLNETLWQEGKAGWRGHRRLARVQTPARPCWNNPLRERKSRKRFHLLHVLFGCGVCCVQVFYISPCLLSLKHSGRYWEGRSTGSCSLPDLDLDVTMGMGRRAIGIGLRPMNHFEYGLAVLTAFLAAPVRLCFIPPVFLLQCWITLVFSWYGCVLKDLM